MSNRDLQSERRQVDQAVDGLTLVDLLNRAADDHGERSAARWQSAGGEWQSLTWDQMRQMTHQIAAGLQTLGVGAGDFVGITAGVRPEHALADLGIVHTAAVPITFYETLAPPQIAYIAKQTGVKVAIVENEQALEGWQAVRSQLPRLERIVLMDTAHDGLPDDVISWETLLEQGRDHLESDPETVTRAAGAVTPSHLATLIYTSGTTGDPKGVMVTHRNVVWTAESVSRTMNMPSHVRTLAYLPFAHIAARAGTHYAPIYTAGEVYYCPDLTQVADYARACRPQAFLGVPRVWEKFQARLLEALEADPKRRDLVHKAIANGRVVVEGRVSGKHASLGKRLKHALFDRIIFSKIRSRLGMEELELAVTAAAPISRDLLVFFHALGIPLYEIYGMSENTGPATCTTAGNLALGTVGKPFMGVEVETIDDGEIRIRGGVVTDGYYRLPQATASTFAEDGWLYSGDLGEWDEQGNLKIVGRKKEIIITSSGKNVAPASLETAVSSHPLVGGVCMVGDNRPYLTMLVSLDPQEAPRWAEQNGIRGDDWEALTNNAAIVAEIQSAMEGANKMVARAEQVKKTAIVPDAWLPDTGEITPSMKVKRHVVLNKYAGVISELYEDTPTGA
ncbi:MAG: long-chain fatty acid--CoA ligase [bacterium]|nr:long-chain fatty acid--CoA ligase [Acidimicrobiia bacterium]MCY4649536.1 long-chain fatty acid--CoA ligase [bacterium]